MKLTEARDRMKAKREAYAYVAGLIPCSMVNVSHEVFLEIQALKDRFQSASQVEDGDLGALEHGEPLIGKCNDPSCAGPHMTPEQAPLSEHSQQLLEAGIADAKAGRISEVDLDALRKAAGESLEDEPPSGAKR